MGVSRNGKRVLKRKTSKKKLCKSLKATFTWIKENRHMKVCQLIEKLNVKLRGHYNYYGITGNSRSLGIYLHSIGRYLFRTLNRRGGKRRNWEAFNNQILVSFPLLQPKIYHSSLAKP
ncbi:MAG: hypothetical protein NTU44_09405 [Bacteroidetes bacterium]|nr:hypothetical protein [Bacteroidota bacterium]